METHVPTFFTLDSLGYIPNNQEVLITAEYLSNTSGIRPVFLIGDEAENLTEKLIELSPSKFRMLEIENSKDLSKIYNLNKSISKPTSNSIQQHPTSTSSTQTPTTHFPPAIISLLLNKRPEVFSNLSILKKLEAHAKSVSTPALLPIVILLNSIKLDQEVGGTSVQRSGSKNKLTSDHGCWASIDGLSISNVAAYGRFYKIALFFE